jgi:TrmH family RNA methyltransferase
MLQRSRIKYIQRLAHKKFRDECGEFVVEGPKLVSELILEKPGIVKGVFALADWLESNGSLLKEIPSELQYRVTHSELEALSYMESPNQVLAIAGKFTTSVAKGKPEGLVLALEDIRDPGNMGTIIRTADWFGVSDIVCSRSTVDVYNPKVVQSTMGSLFRVKVMEVDLVAWLAGLTGTPVLGATLEGRSLYGMPPMGSGVLLVGNESHGLSDEVLGHCTDRVTIPRKGRAESLNASVAAGIMLSHLLKA